MKVKDFLVLKFLLISAVIFFVLFNLGHQPIDNIDEARVASNAIEMYISKNYWITTYEFTQDLWNTKPHLLVLLEVFSFKVFGVSDWALRFPSAISFALLCFLILDFLHRRLNDLYWGIISVFMLVCSESYLNYHGGLSADYDSLLTTLMFAQFVTFYDFINTGNGKYFKRFIALLLFAFLCKGIAGLLFIPGFGVYYLLSRSHLNDSLSLKQYSKYIFFSAIVVFVYFFIREKVAPGYLSAVLENDVFGRFSKSLESNGGPWTFYIKRIWEHDFKLYFFYFLGGLILFFSRSNEKGFRMILYIVFLHFTVISISSTKLFWYIFPEIPFFCIISAFPLKVLLELFSNQLGQYKSKPIFLFVLIMIYFSDDFREKLRLLNGEIPTHKISANYLKNVVETRDTSLNGYLITTNQYCADKQYYKNMANVKNIKLEFEYFSNLLGGSIEKKKINKLMTDDEQIMSVLEKELELKPIKLESNWKFYENVDLTKCLTLEKLKEKFDLDTRVEVRGVRIGINKEKNQLCVFIDKTKFDNSYPAFVHTFEKDTITNLEGRFVKDLNINQAIPIGNENAYLQLQLNKNSKISALYVGQYKPIPNTPPVWMEWFDMSN